MLDPADLYRLLDANGLDHYVGVPDSLLKHFCAYVSTRCSKNKHIIAANEGAAVAIAAGQFLASGSPSVVYLQNSGLGNIVNPILSLADAEVYSIPMLLIIGWRGEPGTKDEPQHLKQGRVTETILEAIGIPYHILRPDENSYKETVDRAVNTLLTYQKPVAILVSKGTFTETRIQTEPTPIERLSRERAIGIILEILSENYHFVCTTGMASREVFEYRERHSQCHARDFLTVGSMGHASSIAYGIASVDRDKRIVCIDGDGAMLMHLGALTNQSDLQSLNLIHVLLNNGSHDSVGGQPTVGLKVDFCQIAASSGYQNVIRVSDEEALRRELNIATKSMSGPNFIEVLVQKGARADLGRPTISPIENRNLFMSSIKRK